MVGNAKAIWTLRAEAVALGAAVTYGLARAFTHVAGDVETFNAQLAETDRLIALTLKNTQAKTAEVMKSVEGTVDPEARRVLIQTNLAAAWKEV